MTSTSIVASPPRRNICGASATERPTRSRTTRPSSGCPAAYTKRCCDFVQTTVAGKHALRIAAYEFHYEPFLRVIKDVIDRRVDVKIVYDARKQPPRDNNRTAVGNVLSLGTACTERTANPSAIAHNKFIVKLEDGQPVAVWTGGTNFSEGGIFGHSNVAHVVEEPAVAAKFLDYWNDLASETPTPKPFARSSISCHPCRPSRPPRVLPSFSARAPTLDALKWYADRRQGCPRRTVHDLCFRHERPLQGRL